MIISVIIPTRHRNDLLAKCLDRLAPGAQLLASEQYEVIVTDDGSESTAESMIRESYGWAKWVPGPRRGPAANRNNGASHASGEWLVFTDDDCLPQASWLSSFVAGIRDDVPVYEGKTTCDAGIHSPLEHSPMNTFGGALWSCNMMARRRVFEELGGFDTTFPHAHMEDADFRERARDSNASMLFVEGAVVDHPPRRIPWGIRLAKLNESEVLYWYKRGNRRSFAVKLLFQIVDFRLRKIFRHRLGPASLLALVSMAIEFCYTAAHVSEWERKYRAMFCDRAAA